MTMSTLGFLDGLHQALAEKEERGLVGNTGSRGISNFISREALRGHGLLCPQNPSKSPFLSSRQLQKQHSPAPFLQGHVGLVMGRLMEPVGTRRPMPALIMTLALEKGSGRILANLVERDSRSDFICFRQSTE